jgi:tetratricopeptide (TPR) repeat protein
MRMFSMSSRTSALCIGAALLLALFYRAEIVRSMTYIYEDVSFARNPSAQYAFELGNKHFRASNPGAYDIERAKYFYRKALELDFNHPMVIQQMARTSFIEGNVAGALFQIDEQLRLHPDSNSSAHYIRALALGYLKRYEEATREYERFIELDPSRWPAYNDLAWTRLQSGDYDGALEAANTGLTLAPNNPWLLTFKSAALFELGRFEEALTPAEAAADAAATITTAQWVEMYPGNDPKSIPSGIRALQDSAAQNLLKIKAEIASSTRS